jgi:MerR family copper efflux transcriptional regulator
VTVLTIQQAAETSGWSPRMLRYVESAGLVVAERSPSGYRLYGAGQLQRLRTLRELVESHGITLTEVGFARRLQEDDALRAAIEQWLAAKPERPADVEPGDWLHWEQAKHQKLLAARPAAEPADPTTGEAGAA